MEEMILTARSALHRVADTYRARGTQGDGRAAALAKTLAELAEVLPERSTGDDLACYFANAQNAKANGRAAGAVTGRQSTCREILSLLEALDAQPKEGGLLMAAAIGRGWADHFDAVAARAAAMATTFRAETDVVWAQLVEGL